jgi:hypothetical protein
LKNQYIGTIEDPYITTIIDATASIQSLDADHRAAGAKASARVSFACERAL